jgi:predicted exporter
MTLSHRMIVGLWLVVLAIATLIIARTPFSTDMSAFLPRSPRPAQQLLVSQLREGVVSRLVLIALEHAPPDALASLSRSLAAKLRQDDQFTVVNNGEASAMTRERDLLWRHRYLLSPAVTPEHFTTPALHRALEADVALLGSDLGVLVKRMLPADPTGEMLKLLQTFEGSAHPASVDGVWFTHDGAGALLMASTRAAGFDIDGQEAALTRIRAAFEAVRREIPEAAAATLVTTGPPVFAVESRARIKGDASRLSLIATILVAGVLLLAYRSARVLVLALLPVASGILVGIAAVSAAFGFVHGITLGFGVTLIGEAVDYAIYLFTQTPPGGALRATLPRIWPTLRLGMLTSVCGFSAMLASAFTGFAQLGLFTIAGLITALAVTRWVLPALLPENFSAAGSVWFATPMLALMRRAAWLRWVVLGVTLAAGLSVALHRAPYWESELSSMSPIPAAETALDARLRREIGAPDVRYMLVVDGADREATLEASERVAAQLEPLVASGTIGGFDAPAQWLPSEASQSARRAAPPDTQTLAANLAAAVVGTPLRGDIFAPFLADVEAARQGHLLRREDLDGTSLALRVDTLLMRRAAGYVALLPLRGVVDGPDLAGRIGALGVPGLVFLDLKRESDDLLDNYRAEALTLSGVGSLVIVALLAVSLRDPRRIAAVLLPLAAAVICAAALLLAGGQRLSIFNLFGLLLVVAVGSNYCLFFERPFSNDRTRMVASLVLANLCTVIGFGILSFSGVPVLHGIGATVALGAFLCLLFGAVLSPSRT